MPRKLFVPSMFQFPTVTVPVDAPQPALLTAYRPAVICKLNATSSPCVAMARSTAASKRTDTCTAWLPAWPVPHKSVLTP
eukprot:295288-Chlamydomonas_euryale.AAC.1